MHGDETETVSLLPQISATILQSIARRYGLEERPFLRLPSSGTINTIYALGRDLVLRVPCNTAEGLADTFTESVAVPVAVQAGVHTPALVIFDESCTLLDVPFGIYERVYGVPLPQFNSDPAMGAAAYRGLGRDMALLHSRVLDCPDPLGRLDIPGMEDPRPNLLAGVAGGTISLADAVIVAGWLDHLAPFQEASPSRMFLHNDIHPNNILVHPDTGDYVALLDWGDAGWGDPIVDFTMLPLRSIPFVLEGYREVALLPVDEMAEARILWACLSTFLADQDRESDSILDALALSPTADFRDLLRGTRDPLPSQWRTFLPQPYL
jgi:aminoglycoside phosphotransferase (APT) family kinase protein